MTGQGVRHVSVFTRLISYIRIAIIALFTAPVAVIAIVAPAVTRRTEIFDWCARAWSRMVLFTSGVRVRTKGTENIVPGRPYVYVSNHASLFDIPAVLAGIPDAVHFVYKKELQKVVFLGWALKASTYIPVVRERGREAARSIEEAARRIREGMSVILFAEGTRSPDGRVQPFKRGAFSLAAHAGVPIIPVTINGSEHVLPKRHLAIRPGTIELVVEPPIPTEGMDTREGETHLMEQVQSIILRNHTLSGAPAGAVLPTTKDSACR
ncbi:MAG: 1-acyl-sn-glycerol-3-phosphate acyltransferase [Ignavibacteriales bacterium CG07_land_8_20_14_0_80_59_12]|nr:MAG: 1-acyl-sn-glycerol-3-phosphate acyltransferase [Ignavibacteriales bacterium CG07_land_8_20_14_0_80_59_12]